MSHEQQQPGLNKRKHGLGHTSLLTYKENEFHRLLSKPQSVLVVEVQGIRKEITSVLVSGSRTSMATVSQ